MKIQEQNEILERYMRDIQEYPLITAEREQELSKIIHNKKTTVSEKALAREEMILGNLRIVVKIAREIHQRTEGFTDKNVTMMDLIQVGNIGLMKAATGFMPNKGKKFSSYVYKGIERRMMKAIKDSRFIRIPVGYYKRIFDINKLNEEYGEMSDIDIASNLNVTKKTVQSVKLNRQCKVPIEDIEDLVERIDSHEEAIPDVLGRKELKNYIYEKIKELNPRHRKVLFYKFFSNQEMTLEKIGKKLGVSRERVRIILDQSMDNLKKKINDEAIQKYFKIRNKN